MESLHFFCSDQVCGSYVSKTPNLVFDPSMFGSELDLWKNVGFCSSICLCDWRAGRWTFRPRINFIFSPFERWVSGAFLWLPNAGGGYRHTPQRTMIWRGHGQKKQILDQLDFAYVAFEHGGVLPDLGWLLFFSHLKDECQARFYSYQAPVGGTGVPLNEPWTEEVMMWPKQL